MSKKKKIRVELRKNRYRPPREKDWTRRYLQAELDSDQVSGAERVRARGELSRRRTLVTDRPEAAGVPAPMPAVDETTCRKGRVVRLHGLWCTVADEEGRQYRCAVRRLLRTLATHERNIVVTGDRVWFRPVTTHEGMIERIEPRHGLLTRASRHREHVIVANVDQIVIVVSLREPELKPHLIDRFLVSAEQGHIAPVICLNKADLVDPAAYQTLIGIYSQLHIPVLLTSATTGWGIDRLREILRGRQSVVCGQSGVGKSSLLNAVQPGLGLEVRSVSEATEKGRHTTTTASLIPLQIGGWVVDTPGIRQFALWDILPQQLEGFFPEFRPYVALCRFPSCTHVHEEGCAVRRAVRRYRIATQRYESYVGLFTGASPD
ncbi:MAG: ribosome small subunit-dependent GTPase A [Gemmataceae bacterium]